MTEIEIKAHVSDPAKTEKIIRAFAEFRKESVKSDVYWKKGSNGPGGNASSDISSDKRVVTAAVSIALTMIVALVAVVCVIAGAGKFTIIALCGGAPFLSAFAALIARLRSRRPQEGNPSFKIRIREEKNDEGGQGEIFVTYKRKELQGRIEVNDEKEFSIDNRSDFEALLSDLDFSQAICKEKKTRTFSFVSPDGVEITIELSFVSGLGNFIEIEILADSPDESEIARDRDLLKSTLSRCGIPESAIEARFYTDMLASISQQ